MPSILRNALAVIAGIVLGSVVNMTLVSVGPSIVRLPEGADFSTMEGLAKSMPLLSPRHFLFPFLAHALGTLTGAWIAGKLGASRRMALALGVSVYFLLGGIAAVAMIGGPLWFAATDLVLAYLPMGYLGAMLAGAGPRRT
ncbi:MAG: hypothetical protein U0939_23390 [Pirellulales bacterium]